MKTIKKSLSLKYLISKHFIAISIALCTLILTILASGSFKSWLLKGIIPWTQFSILVWVELLIAYKLLQKNKKLSLSVKNKVHSKIDVQIQNFAVFICSLEEKGFRYCYLAFVILYIVDTLQILFSSLVMTSLRDIQYGLTFNSLLQLQLDVVGIGIILLTFHTWLPHISQMLEYLYKHKRICTSNGNIDQYYLTFLKDYQASFKRRIFKLIPLSLMIVYAFYYFYDLYYPGNSVTILRHATNTIFVNSFRVHLLIVALILFSCMYCIGVISSVLYLSGKFISKLTQDFDFAIEPLHSDNCGGLRVLGNFCFGLASPIFIGSAFYVGYIFVAVRDSSGAFDLVTVYFVLFVILVYGLLTSIIAFFLPLLNIHRKMLQRKEEDNESYSLALETKRQKIHQLLVKEQLKEAKLAKEELELIQALHFDYPEWPFNVRARFISSTLAIGSSLLLGFLTAFLPPLVQVILHFIGYKQ